MVLNLATLHVQLHAKGRISMRRECLLHMSALHCECASCCLSLFAFNYVALPPACWDNQGIAGRATYAKPSDVSMYAQDIMHVGIVCAVVLELR